MVCRIFVFVTTVFIFLTQVLILTYQNDVDKQPECNFDKNEQEYDPIIRTLNYNGSSEEVKESFSKKATKATQEARETVPNRLDIRYGPGKMQLLDIYGEESSPDDSDHFVFIHGGSWMYPGKDISATQVIPLFDSGIKSIVPGYDLAPDVNLRTMFEEIIELRDFIFSLAEKNNFRNVWFGAHSSGAHLLSNILLDRYFGELSEKRRKMFKGLVLISGVYDLRPIRCWPLVNDVLNLSRKETLEYSPLLYPNEFNLAGIDSSLEVLIVIAEHDPPGFRKQSLDFLHVLQNNGINTSFLDIHGEDHVTELLNLQNSDFILTQEIIQLIKHGLSN